MKNGKKKRKACRMPKCDRAATSRGLCSVCYASAYHTVRRKKTTWAELERLGVTLPATKVRGEFMSVLEELREMEKRAKAKKGRK